MFTNAEVEAIEKEIRLAAEQEGVRYVVQPFSGPASWEFRRDLADRVECLGLLYCIDKVVIFRRSLSKKYVLFYERHPFFSWLLGKKDSDIHYREVENIKENDVNRDNLVRLIRSYLKKDSQQAPVLKK